MDTLIPVGLLWLIISAVLASAGAERQIGGFVAFLISFFLSPIAGFIAVLFSKDVNEERYKREMLENSRKIIALLQNVDANKMDVDEL